MSDMICPGCGIRMFSEKAFREHARDCPELNKPEEVDLKGEEPSDNPSQDAPEGDSQENAGSGDTEKPQGLDEAQTTLEVAPEPAVPPAPTGGDVIPTKDMSVEELRNIAEERAIPGAETMKKSQLFKVLFIDPQKAPQA